MAKKKLPPFVILAIISLVAALVLGIVNMITEGPIAEHKMAALQEAYNSVLPADHYDPVDYDTAAYKSVTGLYAAKDANDQVMGYTVTASQQGYAGPVAVTFGLDPEGNIVGTHIGDTDFVETNGIGARALEPSFQEQFTGLNTDGGSFEALSGATFTSNAVLGATNSAMSAFSNAVLQKEAVPITFGKKEAASQSAADPASLTAGAVMSGSAQGFAGEVHVEFSLNDQLAIENLTVDAATETDGLGKRAMEAEFTDQFTGKTLPINIADIDAIAGATITTTAVVDAVNSAAPKTAEILPGATLEGSAQGFAGTVSVHLTVDDALNISSLTVDAPDETEGLGKRTTEAAFTDQFIGKPLSVSIEDIEAISGATITSTAVIDAIHQALPVEAGNALSVEVLGTIDEGTIGRLSDGQAVISAENTYTGTLNGAFTFENGQLVSGVLATEAPAAPEAEVPVADDDAAQSATAHGFAGDVIVKTVLDGNTIQSLSIQAPDETDGLGKKAEEAEFAEQFVGKTLPISISDIDAIAGATITTTAVVDALNSLAADAEPAPAEEAPAAAGEEKKATAHGFAGDVVVNAVLDGNTIQSLSIQAPDETDGLGKRAEEAEFAAQFVSKTLPISISDIDAIAGATITTTAVVDALNSLAADAEPAPVEEAPAAAGEEKKAITQGFAGDVVVKAVLDGNTIQSLSIQAPDETDGLGKKAEEAEFAAQFVGKTLPISISDIDAITGATITTTAVVDALNSLAPVPAVEETPADTAAQDTATEDTDKADAAPVQPKLILTDPAAPVDYSLSTMPELPGATVVTAPGFGGDVTVLAVMDDLTVKDLAVYAPAETAGLGRLAESEAFVKQFIGKTLPIAAEEVEAISGATITTTAVVDALNSLAVPPEAETTENTETPDPALTAAISVMPELPGATVVTAPGFGGDVTVLAVMDDLTVKDLAVYAPAETVGLGKLAESEDFTKQFVGKTLPLSAEDIESISGATVTTTAVLDALNSLVPQPREITVPGFGGDITISVYVKDNTIQSLTVSAPSETEELGKKAETPEFTDQFVGMTLPVATDKVEAISGATVTTNAVIEALNLYNISTVTVPGFGGDITVRAEIIDGTIQSLSVSAPAETPELGKKAEDAAFTDQFAGKTLPVSLDDIDAITGATITTQAVVNALNSLNK